MDTRKKACPNVQCRTYKKRKYDAKTNYCPECGTELIYVCKSFNCYKPLDISDGNHSYCFECQAKRNDANDKAKDFVKNAAGVVAGVGAVAVVEPLKNALGNVAKEIGSGIAQKVEKKGANIVNNIIKKNDN